MVEKVSELSNKNKANGLYALFAFALCDVSFIAAFTVVILKQYLTIKETATLIALKTFVRLIADIPFGIIADLFGIRICMVASRMLRVVSTIGMLSFLQNGNIGISVLAVVSHGLSMSALYGKVEAHAYNILSSFSPSASLVSNSKVSHDSLSKVVNSSSSPIASAKHHPSFEITPGAEGMDFGRRSNMLVLRNLWKVLRRNLVPSLGLRVLGLNENFGRFDKFGKEDFYGIVSKYYLVVNLLVTSVTFLSSHLVERVGYNALGIATLGLSLFSFLILFYIPDAGSLANSSIPTNDPVKSVLNFAIVSRAKFRILFKNVFTIVKSPQMLMLLFIFGLCSMVTWQSANLMNITLINITGSPSIIGKFNGLHFVSLALGGLVATILPKMLLQFSIRLKLSILNLVSIICFMFMVVFIISVFFVGIYTFIALCALTLVLPTLQLLIETQITAMANKEFRTTIVSVGTFLASTINILVTYLFGIFVNYFSLSLTLAVLAVSPIVILSILLFIYNFCSFSIPNASSTITLSGK